MDNKDQLLDLSLNSLDVSKLKNQQNELDELSIKIQCSLYESVKDITSFGWMCQKENDVSYYAFSIILDNISIISINSVSKYYTNNDSYLIEVYSRYLPLGIQMYASGELINKIKVFMAKYPNKGYEMKLRYSETIVEDILMNHMFLVDFLLE